MVRFWTNYIEPLIQVIQPRRLLEIGADRGWNTGRILAYCRATGAYADIVDPAPQPSLHDVLAAYGPDEHRYVPLKSVAAIPQLEPPDVALIDGDHNWVTVFTELNLLHGNAGQHGVAMPIVISHDVGWPYARRDMYYSPADLDASQRHPYAYKGMLPGISELVEDGMNGTLANATHEGGPRNGVLTGIEDFIASIGAEHFTFRKLPFFNGLGILVPEGRMTPAIAAKLDEFFTPAALLDACQLIETDALRLRATLQQTEACLGRRTEALQRARTLLEQQAARISELERTAAHRASIKA